MSRFCGEQKVEAVLAAMAEWKARCLFSDRALFSDEPVWTQRNLAELNKYFVHNLDIGEGKFMEKLEKQLAPMNPLAKKLAGEMYWVLMIFPKRITPDKKRANVSLIYSWSGEFLEQTHQFLTDAVLHGIGSTGAAYNTQVWRELVYFVEQVTEFKKMSQEQRGDILNDPWKWADWIAKLDEDSSRQMRHILSFLIFPDYFERISSRSHKCDIMKAFLKTTKKELNEITWAEVDRRIYQLRLNLQKEYGVDELDFYSSPLRELWKVEESNDPVDIEPQLPKTRRTWMYAPGEGARFWEEFYSSGIMAIGWDELGHLDDYKDKDAIANELRKHGGDPEALKRNDAKGCYDFAYEMQVGDIVYAKAGIRRIVGWGVISSDYYFDDNRKEFKNVRKVAWKGKGNWEVSDGGKFALKTITEITDYLEFITSLENLVGDRKNPPAPGPEQETPTYSRAQAYEELFFSNEKIDHAITLLTSKKNIILQGPPGVGKTFFAKRLAYAILGRKDQSKVAMVQFHQSYAYEDFLQGYRPTVDGGFELKNGIFYTFCMQAQKDAENDYFFIIDEINRGNLSKIFGELMMLIECDKRGEEFGLPLTYASGPNNKFHIPENLHIIGTMNTADRSLAMVDYALRRRFCFIDLDPAFEEQKYQKFLVQAGAETAFVKEMTKKVAELNIRIEQDKNLGKGFLVGHSFFCPRKGVMPNVEWFGCLVRSEVEPLLKEYWFDNQDEARKAVERLLA